MRPENDNMPPLGPGTIIYSVGTLNPGTFGVLRISIEADAQVRRFPQLMQPHPLCDHLSSRLAPSPPPPKPDLRIV